MANLHALIETMEHRWMRAWINGDSRELKALTARNFRMVFAAKPSVMLDAKSWLDAAANRFHCSSYRFGDVYARDLGKVAIFATQLDIKARLDGHDWSGQYWVTDLWRKSTLRRKWVMVERVVSRVDDNKDVPAAVKSLQLWR